MLRLIQKYTVDFFVFGGVLNFVFTQNKENAK